MMPDLVGKTISHYNIVSLLGKGGMGQVYKAEDTRLKRTVALKFLSPLALGDREESLRFLREAQAAAALQHPSICTVHEIDEVDGHTFIAMAHIDGQTLQERIRQQPLPLDEALEITDQIAAGLEEAHEKGVIHRDIKPANIKITLKGRAKIMDFGLAKLTGATKITRDGMTAGTVAYMSPEQAYGEKIDRRTDIWALGVVLFEMLCGRLPFKGEREQAMIRAICDEDPLPLSSLRSGLPLDLERIIGKCLEKEAPLRYQTIADLRADLLHLRRDLEADVSKPSLLREQPAGYQFRIRRRVALPLALLALAAILLALNPDIREWLRSHLTPAALPEETRLAVLPFTNIGGETENQAFCDGMVEYLSSMLTRLEDPDDPLRVVPASELREAGIASALDARKMFNATLAVTGSILRELDSIILTINLVNTETLQQVDSEVLNLAMTNAWAMQYGVLSEVAEMLEIELQAGDRPELSAGQTESTHAYIFYLSGRGDLQRHDDSERIAAAIESFGKALEQDPDYALAHAGLGEAYWRMYQRDKDVSWVARAIESSNRALELDPGLPDVHVTQGMIHLDTGHPEQAIQDFEQALALDALDSNAYRGLARAHEALRESDLAEAAYLKAIEQRPKYWAGYRALGRFYWKQGRLEEAASSFLEVIATTPDNYHGYSNLGGIYLQMGRRDEARNMFTRSIEIKPNYPAYSNLGTLFYNEGDYRLAAHYFEEALALSDKDHRLWGNLASCYMRLPGEIDKADEPFRRAIEAAEAQRLLNPQDPYLLSRLGGYYAQFEDSVAAQALLVEAYKLAPKDMNILFRIGHNYEILGDRDRALEFLRLANEHGYPLERIESMPTLRFLRNDPRYRELFTNEKNVK